MILEVENLSYGYEKNHLLFKNVNFSLEKGEVFAILGANGAGKYTMMNCIANLLHPLNGEIRLKGWPLSKLSLRQASRIIGYVPQMHTAAYGYDARDFVAMGRVPYLNFFQQPSREDYALVDEAMEELGIAKLAYRPYTELSGGERQQVSIARAIVQQPDIIMLDEPTNHLDYGNQLRMMHLIQKLSRKGYTIIITSHIPDHVLLLGGKAGILNADGSFMTGRSEEVMTEENLRKIYQVDVRLIYMKELGRKVCVSGGVCHEENTP